MLSNLNIIMMVQSRIDLEMKGTPEKIIKETILQGITIWAKVSFLLFLHLSYILHRIHFTQDIYTESEI